MIEIKNLTKKYNNKLALDDVTLNIDQGELIGLFGENGAGKTTLIKSIFGFINYQGEILLDGQKIDRNNLSRLSFASSEHTFFPNIDAKAHGEFYREHFDRFNEKRFNGLMDFFGLPYDKPIRTFSFGQQNQFEVLMALSQGADYIFMDEPFTGNDVFNREDFYKLLVGVLEPHETIFLSTHLIEEVSGFVDRAVLLRHGKIIGDVNTMDLEERRISLIDYVKENYDYQADRVSKALKTINGEDDENA